MVEWVTKAHSLLVNSGITNSNIKTAVHDSLRDGRIRLRDGVVELLRSLEAFDIPLLIFSAGIADVLEEVVKTEAKLDALPENVVVVSNKCIFGSDEKLNGFELPIFHVFNKRGSSILQKNEKFLQKTGFLDRKSLILLGDSLGDLSMADGLKGARDSVLCIGFLNDRVDERLEQYLKLYDVVILGDPELSILLDMVFKQILFVSND